MGIEAYVPTIAAGFDTAREATAGAEAKLVLLREDGEGQSFDLLRTIETGWWPAANSQYFGNLTVNVADITAAVGADMRKATHFVVRDSVIPAFNLVLHEKAEAETAPPDTVKPWWRLRGAPLDRRWLPPA